MEAMLKHAQDVLRMEAEAILELVPRVDENFAAAVKLILDCQGRTVITGMGKSGLIGRKMAATLASTGTPSFYLHPAEGIHGDLGMVTESDVVIALSNSGETCAASGQRLSLWLASLIQHLARMPTLYLM